MSTARWGKKWADVDEDDDDNMNAGPDNKGSRFETKADKDGIKTVIEYVERDGATYRVTRKVKQNVKVKWINKDMIERKTMAKFGKALTNSEAEERTAVVRSVEEVNIELAKKVTVDLSQKDDAEEKFFEESLKITESLLKEKKVWTDMNKEMKEQVGGEAEVKEPEKKEEATLTAGAPGKYVPPSLRGKGEGGDGKGKGKGKGGGGGGDFGQVEASLRVFNLSDDVKEGDLQDLFGQCGRLQRVFLAKDMTTFASKGFAFITYYNREDAQKAIDRLNGHGYDNLIMKVEWAKPRA